MIKKISPYWLLFVVIICSLFFRFYNYKNFQYWSSDEEIAAAVVRKMIVEKRPILISPNSTIGTSLGSYFHILSVPLFAIFNLNPVYVLASMGLLGTITSILLFLIGQKLNKKLAFTGALLYSTSFVMALFDRRWWPLSLNPLLVSCAIYSFYQIIAFKKYWFCLLLAASIGFAAHADPSLGIITISAIFTFIFLKIPLKRKEYLGGLFVLFLFAAPLLLFEIHHPGSIFKPIVSTLGKVSQTSTFTNSIPTVSNNFLNLFSKMIAPKPSTFAEIYIASGYNPLKPVFSPLPEILIVIFLFYPLYRLFKIKKENNEKIFLKLLYIFLFTFSLLSFLFVFFYKRPFHQHYFTIIFPIFFLLIAYTLTQIKNHLIFIGFLLIFVAINGFALINSSFRYPLNEKLTLVSNLSNKLNGSNFSLYARGDAYFIGGGFTELFILKNNHPKKSYIYPFYDWIYQAHGLYTVKPEKLDQNKIIIIDQVLSGYNPSKIDYKTKVGNMEGIILDNSTGWFNESKLR